MANQLTFTGPIGPGGTATSLVFRNVNSVNFDYIKQVAFVNHDSDVVSEISIAGITTISHSISGTAYTITVS